MNSLTQTRNRLVLGVVALSLGLWALAACGGETVVEKVVETVVVEKAVTRVETVIETVVVEKQVEGQTVRVVETVVVEKAVTRVETVVETVVVVEVATTAPAPTIPPAQRVQRVIVGHDEPYALIDHINPYVGSRGGDLAGGSLYDRLNDLDDTLAPVARLGTGWSVSSDGTQWTYTLREGVKFKNGQDFSSADVSLQLAAAARSGDRVLQVCDRPGHEHRRTGSGG